MDFIGRTSELATLNAELERGSGFVVIYGRRRVGKTTLIKEFIKDKRAFYFLATTESEAQSMKRFAGVLSRTTKNPMLSKVTFTDWLDLFQVVADDHPDEKKVLVIDEFPYLVKTNPDFPSILQNAWDEVLKDHNVMLILCGSLISMMKKHALAYDSPLYGRRTAQIRLMPLQFTDVYAAQNLSFEQAVEQYAITGGVPKYMEFFQTDEPLVEQIRRVVLSKNGFLYEEPDFLLNEEVQTPINYFSVLKAISDGNHKLSKIGMTMEQDTSAITPYLKTLIDLGFVIKNVPITEKNPERSRKSLYYRSRAGLVGDRPQLGGNLCQLAVCTIGVERQIGGTAGQVVHTEGYHGVGMHVADGRGVVPACNRTFTAILLKLILRKNTFLAA